MDIPLDLPREYFEPKRIGVHMEAPPSMKRKAAEKAMAIPDPPRLSIQDPEANAEPLPPHNLQFLDEDVSKGAAKPMEDFSPRVPDAPQMVPAPPLSLPQQQVMGSEKAQMLPPPPRLSERDFDLQARNDGFRQLLEHMHRLEEAEANRAEWTFKTKGKRSQEPGRKSGRKSVSLSPPRKDPTLSDDPRSPKASKKAKMKKKLTRSFGKEKAKEMRQEANSVANEFFSTATAFTQPGTVWHE